MKFLRAVFAALLLTPIISHAGVGVVSVQIVPSGDGILYSRFPAGDAAPGPGNECDVPSGWACVNLGNGGGSITQTSATEWNLDVFGTSSVQNQKFAYKTGGSGDVQLKFRITDTYTGNLEPLSSVGGGFREGLTNTDYFFQGFSPYASTAAIQVNYGTSSSDFVNVNGAAGQTRPRWGCATYDESSSTAKFHASADGATWTEVASVTRDFSSIYAVLFGQSKSATAAMQATIDNISLATGVSAIDCYTPTDPPAGNPPTLVTQIPNQNLTLSIAFGSCFAGNFSEPDGQAMTYSADLPAGTGLSFNASTGCFSGAPDSDDVAASPYNVEICAIDVDLLETCDVSQFTVISTPGNVRTLATGVTNTTCAALNAVAGDTIKLLGTSRSKLKLSNCTGTASSPIRVINDTSETSAITVTGASGFVLQCDNCVYVEIDGTGKWSGAGSGACGNSDTTNPSKPPSTTRNCGIKVSASGAVTAFVKISGSSHHVTVKGVEVNGTGNAGQIGVDVNDHNYTLSGVTQLQCKTDAENGGSVTYPACEWREGIVLDDNYVHDTDEEGIYFGANAAAATIDDLPLRCNQISRNYVKSAGFDALGMKSNITATPCGNSLIFGNFVDDAGGAGLAQNGNSGACIALFEGGFADVYGNYVEDCVGPGILDNTQNRPSSYGPLPLSIYNNIVVRAGTTGTSKNGINIGRSSSSTAEIEPEIYNNTIVDPDGKAISVEGSLSPCLVKNNIAAGSNSTHQNITATQCSPSTNLQDVVGDIVFVNTASDANEDYHIQSSSPARQGAPSGAPSTDIDGDARPQQATSDQGADEYKP